ncbi:GAF domain-containing protein [uncultured Sunxiuqinia sp.]|uniref:GAF domain-containing protein n=1 Tax=uncultured Sunxiuqinia sp. TaxID=1573825 RepID=UPI0030D97A8A|tara:strand:+ start:9562 stop:10008 length:447 start_codon:yes stop_codon:yes gene_type:complete
MKTDFSETLNQIKDLVKSNPENLRLQICQLLKEEVYHYDWVGFYQLNDGVLHLGDYAGKATDHTRIEVGKGVCGQVAEKKETIIVQDVSQEDNYIACSLDVQSEIVVPILRRGEFIAELDIDSHSPAPFSEDDQIFLEQVCALVADSF